MEHTVEVRNGVAVVSVSGDIDVSHTLVLREALATSMEAEAPRLVIDLSDVDFVDSAGIGLLVTAHRRAAQTGGRLVLTGVNDVVAHVLALTRTDRLLTVAPSVERAVAAAAARS